MTHFSIACSKKYALSPFYKGNKPLACNAPLWGMTFRKAGSMRFRWNEANSTRDALLSEIASAASPALTPVPLELIHSTIVYDVSVPEDTFTMQGDGILTINKLLLPTVTVADCMPIFFYEEESGAFGLVHSGWKGTGIIKNALELARQNYGTRIENVCVALGPHIRSCCYIVDETRAAYFKNTFGESCIVAYDEDERAENTRARIQWNNSGKKLYSLSLERANLAVLEKIGVRDENIAITDDCTCCNDIFGSFRRESAGICEAEKWKHFTVQAAFCGWM